MAGPTTYFSGRKGALRGAVILFSIAMVCYAANWVVELSHEVQSQNTENSLMVDSLRFKRVVGGSNICDLVLANDFKEIKPSMISWATDLDDPYSESYIINNDSLKIWQPLKRFDLPDSNRRYFYKGKAIRTVRVLIDSLEFNFNNISIDYGYEPRDIYQNGSYVLLRNEPVSWCGTANRFRFMQLFDLNDLVCYEFFADYYACLGNDSPLKILK
jgi:hypothetical protein